MELKKKRKKEGMILSRVEMRKGVKAKGIQHFFICFCLGATASKAQGLLLTVVLRNYSRYCLGNYIGDQGSNLGNTECKRKCQVRCWPTRMLEKQIWPKQAHETCYIYRAVCQEGPRKAFNGSVNAIIDKCLSKYFPFSFHSKNFFDFVWSHAHCAQG